MKHIIYTVCTIICIVCFIAVESSPGIAQGVRDFSSQYPGKRGKGYINVGFQQVQVGAQRYFSVYERWPVSWKEVKESGIFQADLYGPELQVIDPDDNKLDFTWDVVFEPRDLAAPKVHTLLDSGDLQSGSIWQPYPFRVTLQTVARNYDGFEDTYWSSDPKRLVLLAIVFQLNSDTMPAYYERHKKNPSSVQDLLDDGMSPIRGDSINPLTNSPFRFDGSANDILVLNDSAGFTFVPVDASGQRPGVSFNF